MKALSAVPLLAVLAGLWLPGIIYGEVRDQYGTPLMTSEATVLLETASGVVLSTSIAPGVAPGVNYQLQVPMDAGTTPDLYEANALLAAAPFKMYVVLGGVTNTPIQMTGNFALLGQPGQQTRIDLFLGVDANGDGLPDAWENAFLAALGGNYSLSEITSNSILANDGRTALQEFLAGNLLFDPADSPGISIVSLDGESPILQFTAITGRSYTVLGSTDLNVWSTLSFTVPAEGLNGATHSFYFARSIGPVQVQTTAPGGASQFFRLLVQ
jgi:hypothetical protein